MALHGPVDRLEEPLAAEVVALASLGGPEVGHTQVGGPGWPALTGAPGFTATWATEPDGQLVAYLQALRSPAEPNWTAELLVSPEQVARTADLGAPLLSAAVRGVAAQGGGTVHLWASDAGAAYDEVAARAGLVAHRALHKMERPLPLGLTSPLEVRPFVVGQDEEAALEVNRRAFAQHPEQGDMTRAMLDERMVEPWFDPAGFLVHDVGGRMAGFCWTKLFAHLDPVVGEIHVICVDPDFAGRGLGHELVVAGLDHLAGRGATVGMLFVEADNAAALALYERLGFATTRTDRSWTIAVAPA